MGGRLRSLASCAPALAGAAAGECRLLRRPELPRWLPWRLFLDHASCF